MKEISQTGSRSRLIFNFASRPLNRHLFNKYLPEIILKIILSKLYFKTVNLILYKTKHS